MEPRYIEDVHGYKDQRQTTKPRVDETRASQRQVTTEKVTVTRTDGSRTDEIERRRHPKDYDVGRIVIEEIPEEKEEKPQVYRKYQGKPRTTAVTITMDDVKDVSKTYQKEDVTEVGRIDGYRPGDAPEESRKLEDRLLTKTERIDHHEKVGTQDVYVELS